MFSGKTSELVRQLRQFTPSVTRKFKHVIDTRYRTDAIVTHYGYAMSAMRVSTAAEITNRTHAFHEVVAIDEAHFFELDLIDAIQRLNRRGIHVIVTSLDRDSWGRPFRVAQMLQSLAQRPIVLVATCARCGGVADHTQRLTPIVDGNMVGGPESYEPRCRACWHPPEEAETEE